MKQKNLSIDGINFYLYDVDDSVSNDYFQTHLEEDYYGMRSLSLSGTPVIVDLGAHTGGFSIFLAKRFPSATIHAVEPLIANYDNLAQACTEQSINNVITHNLAVKGVSGEIIIGVDHGLSASAKEIGEEAIAYRNQVQAVTLPDFMSSNNISFIDLLKINIEGGEYSIFNSLTDEWLTDNIGNIVGELHYAEAISLEARIKTLFPNANIRFA
jgi:FkbM family methyltransferase